jgi:hypothetical protein
VWGSPTTQHVPEEALDLEMGWPPRSLDLANPWLQPSAEPHFEVGSRDEVDPNGFATIWIR